MNNEHYLIHKEDYIKHINDKVFLYSMVKQLTHMVSKLAPNRGNKALSEMAECYNGLVERNFRTWGIPTAYLVFDNEALLSELIENELIAPEEAGYYPCDGECCCDDCECCCSDAHEDEPADEDTTEAMATLTSMLHGIFGDNVSVHIVVD